MKIMHKTPLNYNPNIEEVNISPTWWITLKLQGVGQHRSVLPIASTTITTTLQIILRLLII